MKLKKANRSLLGLLAAGSLLSSGSASAFLILAGAYDFDAGLTPENGDVNLTGFSSTIFKTDASLATGGSTDSTYGPGAAPGRGGQTYPNNLSSGNDGYLVTRSTSGTQFEVVAHTNVDRELTALLFDASSSNMQVAYSINGGVSQGLTSPTVTSTDNGFYNFMYDLAGLNIVMTESGNQTISFSIRPVTGNAFLDNIALTAVPEPGSLIALGCVMGSGMLLRTRRRSSVVSEVAA